MYDFILKIQHKTDQEDSLKLLLPRTNKSSLHNVIRHLVWNSSELENEKIEQNPAILGLSKTNSHQPITPYKVFVERAKQYSMGCECGLGTKGEATKTEAMSRIVDGYQPMNQPWMVHIKIQVILQNNHNCEYFFLIWFPLVRRHLF